MQWSDEEEEHEEERIYAQEEVLEQEEEEEDTGTAEALLLVAEYLRRATPCSRAAAVLCEEIEEHGLLGNQRGYNGSQRPLTVDLMRRGMGSIPQDLLLRQLRAAASQNLNKEEAALTEEANRLGDDAAVLRRGESPEPSILWPAPISERALLEARSYNVEQQGSPTGEVVTALTELRKQSSALPYALDKRILSSDQYSRIKYNDKPERIATLSGHRGYSVYCVAFDRTGEFVITGADDHLVKVWHAPSCRLRSTLRGHRSVIADLAISYDNSCLASGSEDGTVRLWRLHDGKCLNILRVGLKKPLHRSEISRQNIGGSAQQPRGQTAGVAPRAPAQQVELEPAAILSASFCAVSVVKFDQYGNLYAAATDCADVRCWDTMAISSSTSPELLAGGCWPHLDSSGHNDTKLSALTVGSELGATGTKDGTLRLWKLYSQDKNAFSSLIEAESAVKNFLDNNVAGIDGVQQTGIRREGPQHRALKDRLIKARESVIKSVCLFTIFDAHAADLTDLDFSYASDRLLSASMQHCTAKIWAWVTHGSSKIWRHACLELNISGGGHSTTSSSSTANRRGNNGTASRNQQQSNGLSSLSGSKRELTSVAWSQDDSLVFISTFARPKRIRGQLTEPRPGDQRIDIFEANTGTKLRSLLAHTWDCFALAPHPRHRNSFVSGGHDGALRFWELDAKSTKPIAELLIPPDEETQQQFLEQQQQQQSGVNVSRQQNDDDDDDIQAQQRLASNALGLGQRLDGRSTAASECWPGEIWSATWSVDGSRLAAVDLVGQLHLFGPRGNKPVQPVPRDQYLASDYAELVWDDQLYALDATTRVAPHLAPREFARNFMRQNHTSGEPFPLIVDAREVPHRPNLPAAQIAPTTTQADATRHDLTKAVLPETMHGTLYKTLTDIRTWWYDARELIAATKHISNDLPSALSSIGHTSQRRVAISSPRAIRRLSSNNDNRQWIVIDEDQPNAGAEFDLDADDDDDFDADMHDDDDEDDDDDDDEEVDDEIAQQVQARRRTLRQNSRSNSRSRRRRNQNNDDTIDESEAEEDNHRPVLRSSSRRAPGDRLGGNPAPRMPRRALLGAVAQQRATGRQQRHDSINYDEEDDENEEESSLEIPPPRRSSRRRAENSSSNRRSTRRAIVEDDDEDDDLDNYSSEEQQEGRRQRRSRRLNNTNISSRRSTRRIPEEDDVDDEISEQGDQRQRRSSRLNNNINSGSRRDPQRRDGGRTTALSDEDDEEINMEEEEDEELDIESDSPAEKDESDAGESDEEEQMVVVNRKPVRTVKVDSTVLVRDWTRQSRPARPEEAEYLQYTPQSGDDVVYIPQGHAALAVEIGAFDAFGGDNGPPWRENSLLERLVASGGHGAIACRVESVQYEFPEKNQSCRSIVAVLELVGEGVVANVTDPLCSDFIPIAVGLASLDETLKLRPRRATRRDSGVMIGREDELRFYVPFRRSDAPDFLIPKKRFERALGERRDLLIAGTRANFPMVDEEATSRYPCTLNMVSFKPGEPRRIEKEETTDTNIIWDFEGREKAVSSVWERIKITCDDGSEYNCSPWEIEPLQDSDDDDQEEIWPTPKQLTPEVVESLSQVINRAINIEQYEGFITPVIEQFPDETTKYLETVPVPIELQLMRDRLASGYYRQLEAFEDDARHLALNCSKYTGASSPWTKNANSLREFLLKAVDSIRNPQEDDQEEHEAPPRNAGRKRQRSPAIKAADEIPPAEDDELPRPRRTKRQARFRTGGAGLVT
mmetsp:Transcript_22145/g.26637  ORF Transcript_22145/g.26637 Transcript_22145/m.26637 type:complete len:1749 (+) Transcript_22145:34-5280(+)